MDDLDIQGGRLHGLLTTSGYVRASVALLALAAAVGRPRRGADRAGTGSLGPHRTQYRVDGGTEDVQSVARWTGERVDGLTPNDLVRRGCIQVMEGRHCFGHLSIEENLLTGAFTRQDGRAGTAASLEMVYNYFPRLRERRDSQAGYASGGEQQMCAIGRALMAKPNMALLDEPSMGLAPQIVEQIFEIVHDINTKEGVSFLLAEQNTNVALRFATYGYILENGRIVMDGDAKTLRENEDVKEFYLGIGGTDRKSFRDGKSYKRRKRWLA